MKVSRHIILATLLLNSFAGISAMFPGYRQAPNMGNMFGQQPRMQMPQGMFNQIPGMRQQYGQQFANPMMYMNQFGTNQSASDQALAAFMNWMMTSQPYYLQTAISKAVQILADNYYPQKLKNIWWTRVIIDTVLARLTTKAIEKVMTWNQGQETE